MAALSSHQTSAVAGIRRTHALSTPQASAGCGPPATVLRFARRAAGLALTGQAELRLRADRATWQRRARPVDRDMDTARRRCRCAAPPARESDRADRPVS